MPSVIPTLSDLGFNIYGRRENADLNRTETIDVMANIPLSEIPQQIPDSSISPNQLQVINYGQTAYNTGIGYWLGVDKGTPKFSIGDSTLNSLTWNGVTLAIAGSITATTGAIGGFDIGSDYIRDTANSMGLASTVTVGDDVRFWSGATFANRATAPFRVTEAGAVTGSSVTITGGSVATSTLNGLVGLANTNLSAQGWTFTSIFSSTDYNTIAWTSGTFTSANGTAYSIDAGNTGNMTLTTYIYLDIAVSVTVLQATTTALTAIGSGRVLIAVAFPNTDTTSDAIVQVFGGTGGQILSVDSLAANSASTNEFVSNTAQIANLVVTNAKINDLNVSKLVAGTITSKAVTLAVSDGQGDVYFNAGKTDFTNTESGFILGIDDSDGNKAKLYMGDSSNYLNWDGTTLTIFNLTDGTEASAKHVHDFPDLYQNITRVVIQDSYAQTQVSGGATLADYGGSAYLSTGGGSGDYVVTTPLLDSDISGKNLKWFARGKLGATTNQDVVLGVVASTRPLTNINGVLTEDHVAFIIDDATLYASVGDGATQNRSDISAGVTLTNFNRYYIKKSGSNYLFYVNSTLKWTSNGNEPNGLLLKANIGIRASAAETKTLHIFQHVLSFDE